MSMSRPNDFAAEVMATLIKRKVTMKGLRPSHISLNVDGSMKIWFGENGNAKSLTILDVGIDGAYVMGQSDVVADMAEKMIDHSNSRYY